MDDGRGQIQFGWAARTLEHQVIDGRSDNNTHCIVQSTSEACDGMVRGSSFASLSCRSLRNANSDVDVRRCRRGYPPARWTEGVEFDLADGRDEIADAGWGIGGRGGHDGLGDRGTQGVERIFVSLARQGG